jgi:uncharacterized protein (DUF433 family)
MADELIVSDVGILGGKPCVRGTRLSVEFPLELAASGATQADMLARYQQLTADGLAAAFRNAADALKGEQTPGAQDHGMKPLEYAILVDENIGPEAVPASERVDVTSGRPTNRGWSASRIERFSSAPSLSGTSPAGRSASLRSA